MRSRTLATLLTCSCTALGLAACGDDDDGDRTGSTPGDPPTTTATTPAETTTQTGTTTTTTTPAAGPVSFTAGTTTLRLSPTVATVLSTAGIEVRAVAPARKADDRTLTFPVVAGRIDPAEDDAVLRHRGGVEFRAGGGTLRATDLRLSPGSGTLTGVVRDRRVTLFDVPGAEPQTTDDGLRYSEVEARIGDDLAVQLEDRIGGDAIPNGLTLGTVGVELETAG